MSPVWLLAPLYLAPLVTSNEVVLTILVYTFILGILAVGFNIVFGYAGQLTMFHAAAFGIPVCRHHVSKIVRRHPDAPGIPIEKPDVIPAIPR